MFRIKLCNSKKSFTLLEVMIAICIFSAVASVSGWQIFRMISSYKFNNQVDDCLSSLQNAQALALVYRTDLIFEIFMENDLYHYRIYSNEPFSSAILDQRKKYSLSAIKTCTYNNCLVTRQKWDISSRGLILPRGIIHFSKRENDGLWIDLQKGFLVQCTHTPPIKEVSCNYDHLLLNTRNRFLQNTAAMAIM